MKILYYMIRPFDMLFSFITDLLNNNPKVLLMKFLAICFFGLSCYITYRYKFVDWYSVAGFAISGILSFLFAVFSYMEDKKITFEKIKDGFKTAMDAYKSIKKNNE